MAKKTLSKPTAFTFAAIMLASCGGLSACGRETVSVTECVAHWNSSVPVNFEGFPDDAEVWVEPIDEQDRLGFATCSVSWYRNGLCAGSYSWTMPNPTQIEDRSCSGPPVNPPQIPVEVEAGGEGLQG